MRARGGDMRTEATEIPTTGAVRDSAANVTGTPFIRDIPLT